MAGMAATIFGAVYDLVPTLDPDVQVVYATRATQANQDVVGITAITTETTRPTLGRDPRSRDELHNVTVIASVFRPGPGPATQRLVVERAFAYIDLLAEYLRAGNGPTLGLGGNVDAWVSGTELDVAADNEDIQAAGRYAAVTAAMTVAAFRI